MNASVKRVCVERELRGIFIEREACQENVRAISDNGQVARLAIAIVVDAPKIPLWISRLRVSAGVGGPTEDAARGASLELDGGAPERPAPFTVTFVALDDGGVGPRCAVVGGDLDPAHRALIALWQGVAPDLYRTVVSQSYLLAAAGHGDDGVDRHVLHRRHSRPVSLGHFHVRGFWRQYLVVVLLVEIRRFFHLHRDLVQPLHAAGASNAWSNHSHRVAVPDGQGLAIHLAHE